MHEYKIPRHIKSYLSEREKKKRENFQKLAFFHRVGPQDHRLVVSAFTYSAASLVLTRNVESRIDVGELEVVSGMQF